MARNAAAVLILSATVSCVPGHTSERWPDWLRPCGATLEPRRAGAFCGSYEVWEDRSTKEGRRIGLRVLVLPAKTHAPLPDPVFYLMGGPGGAATEAARGGAALLRDVAKERDLVFVDQRGSGGSSPLDCEVPGPNAAGQELLRDFLPADMVRACLQRQTADVRHYTTPIAMDDLDEVRRALGYRQINLYGGSYGTRAAQVYLRRHPESVRSAVLKGVAPMDMENPLPFARALDRGVRRLLEDCSADSRCRRTFPDLAEDWARAKGRFVNGAVSVELRSGWGGVERVTLSRGVFADGVRHILYTVQDSKSLPALLHAAANGDFEPFVERELRQAAGYDSMLSMGMFLTVTCSEDVGFVTEDDIERATRGTFLGDYRIRRQLEACEIWGTGAGVDDGYQEPVRSNVPVLLISGELDTATPVEGGERVAKHLSRSLHLVVPNESHGFANFECERKIIGDFIDRGGFDELDTSCIAETERPPFSTH